MPPQFLIVLLLIYFRLDSISSQRFYACEPNCVMDHCEDANNEPVCVHIIEVDPDGRNVEFPSKCAFDCANRCYEKQLRIKKKGTCGINVLPAGQELPAVDPGGDEDDER